jgi:HK97 family phage prohead protease
MKRATYDGVLTKQHDPIGFEKADAESGILSGYCSKWWEVDSYLETTAPGSFSKTISERGPKSGADRMLFRYEHEWTVGKHLDITEDETGPKIEAFVSDDGNWGTTLRRHLADGVPYGLSIGFRRIASRPGTKDDPFDLSRVPPFLLQDFDPANVTVLTEVKLLENSAVSFPAVDSALIDSYRSDDHDLTQRAIDRLLADLKADRLTPAQLTELRRLAALVPAASGPDPDERSGAPAASPDSTPTARNYHEMRLQLLELGIAV